MASLNNLSTGTILNSPFYGTVTTTTNQNLVFNNTGTSYTIDLGSDITDFFELVLAALGYEITYEDFKKMSKNERIELIRDIKLKTII
jgi:hypothetical protein